MPTLDELLNLLKEAPDMLINIELKCPHSPEIRALYDYENACAVIKTYIDQYQIDEERTIVSSYEPLMTTKMVEMAPKRQFKILQLLNYDAPETDYPTPKGMDGINIDLHWLD